MYIHTYIYTYIYVHTHTPKIVDVALSREVGSRKLAKYLNTYVYTYIYIILIYILTYIYIYTHISIYIYIYICVYICIHIYIYIYVHIHLQDRWCSPQSRGRKQQAGKNSQQSVIYTVYIVNLVADWLLRFSDVALNHDLGAASWANS